MRVGAVVHHPLVLHSCSGLPYLIRGWSRGVEEGRRGGRRAWLWRRSVGGCSWWEEIGCCKLQVGLSSIRAGDTLILVHGTFR